MINFFINDTQITIQAIPLYGLAVGFLYYNPNLEPDLDSVDEDDYFEQITIMFLFFGIHITII